MRTVSANWLPSSPPELRPRSLMPFPLEACRTVAGDLELQSDTRLVSIVRSAAVPIDIKGLSILGVSVGAMTIVGCAVWAIRAHQPNPIVVSAILLFGIIFVVGFAAPYVLIKRLIRHERRSGAIVSADTLTRTLSCHRAGWSFPLDQIIALRVISGRVDAKPFKAENHVDVIQLCVDYRPPDGRMRRRLLACPLYMPGTHVRLSTRHASVWHRFSEGAVIPVHFDRIPSEIVLGAHEVRPEALDSDAYDIALEPVVEIPSPKSLQRQLQAGSPVCRMCGYSLEGLSSPPHCPECGTDFSKNPTART